MRNFVLHEPQPVWARVQLRHWMDATVGPTFEHVEPQLEATPRCY